jgi:hypothetical protein
LLVGRNTSDNVMKTFREIFHNFTMREKGQLLGKIQICSPHFPVDYLMSPYTFMTGLVLANTLSGPTLLLEYK